MNRPEADWRGLPPTPDRPVLPRVVLRGVAVHAITEAQCVQHVLAERRAGRGGWVVTPNLDHLRRLGRDGEFASLYAGADLVVADGMPLLWASRLQGTPLPERVSGSNLVSSLTAAAAPQGWSVYLLGGVPGAAEGAAAVLQSRHSGLLIAGTHYPPFGFESDPKALAELAEEVRLARPDIVFVALGSPKQEQLIARLKPLLPQAWWLGVGISFSFLAGDVRRAPLWMQKSGLEWLHRLGQEPGRLARRYLIEGLPFAAKLLTGAAVCGVKRAFTRRSSAADSQRE